MAVPERSLEERVERLERLVEELHRSVSAGAAAAAELAESASPAREPRTSSPPASHPAAPSVAPAWRARAWDSELWLNKLGVGLVLFGVSFLFKYSIDQGWLTPLVRVAFGALVATTLLGFGLRLGERQRGLARVLLGGAIGVYYIVGFAAFQLYALVGYDTAFAYMVGVTLGAFTLAVREDHAVLSLIGVKGALGTPFLLYSGDGNLPWLIAYSCVVIASGVALHLYRGWRSVLWTAVVGGWAVFSIAYAHSIAGQPPGFAGHRWILQHAVLFCWLSFAALPLWWELRWGALARPAPPAGAAGPALRLELHLYLLTVSTPLLGLALSGLIWSMSGSTWGWLAIAAGGVYAAVGGLLLARDDRAAGAHLLAASLLLPIGSVAAFGGERLYIMLAVQAAVFHLAARVLGLRGPRFVAHALFAACATWFLVRLDVAGVVGSWRALSDPLVIALAFAASASLGGPREVRVYRFAVHGATLAWLWRELSALPNGEAYVSAAWGAYALGLLVLGLRRRLDLLQKTALATLLLVVAKLFVVDLAALEALWRILLFLGLGAVFLLLSYLLQGFWEDRARMARR